MLVKGLSQLGVHATPCTGPQSITRIKERNRQPFMLFRIANMSHHVCLWPVGGSWSTRAVSTQAQGQHTNFTKGSRWPSGLNQELLLWDSSSNNCTTVLPSLYSGLVKSCKTSSTTIHSTDALCGKMCWSVPVNKVDSSPCTSHQLGVILGYQCVT